MKGRIVQVRCQEGPSIVRSKGGIDQSRRTNIEATAARSDPATPIVLVAPLDAEEPEVEVEAAATVEVEVVSEDAVALALVLEFVPFSCIALAWNAVKLFVLLSTALLARRLDPNSHFP